MTAEGDTALADAVGILDDPHIAGMKKVIHHFFLQLINQMMAGWHH